MPTEWFDRKPGEGYIKPTDESRPEGEQMVILGDKIPDWVRLPHTLAPPLAGLQARVVRHFASLCPLCHAPAKVLELETPSIIDASEHGNERLHTSECSSCEQFAVYWAEYEGTTGKTKLDGDSTEQTVPPAF